MERTNHYLIDFLGLDPSRNESLWRAGRPTACESAGDDVVLTVPLYAQRPGWEIQRDPAVPPRRVTIRLRAYGPDCLRVRVTFAEPLPETSPMLQPADDLRVIPLRITRQSDGWRIDDTEGRCRALVCLADPPVDPWSDLLPPPDPTLALTFLPDGRHSLSLSAYDQFFPARHDALALAAVLRDDRVDRCTLSFHAAPDEVFVGTGERFSKLDHSGRTFTLINQDAQGVNNRRAYKNVPLAISSRGVGFFQHTSCPTRFSFADHSTRSVQLLAEEDGLDLFLFGGDGPEAILRSYRRLTGFPALPPLWSFGIWMSRMTYFSADEVRQVCRRLRQEDYPCDVIHLDTGWFETDWLCEWTFNPERFPDPAGFMADLKAQGFRVSLWQMPYIAAKARQHDEAAAHRYMAPLDRAVQQGGSNFSALDYAGTIDMTYPEAVRWYQGLLCPLLELGAACIKTDFGEEIHLDARYHGMDARRLRNLYALLYQKAVFEVTAQTTGEGIIWARAGWAGCQRYPVHWGGDAACSWDGMAGSLRGGLHLGLSGFGFWSHDVPGFHGVPDFMNSVVPDDLMVRWTQFGVFTSHLRYHGTSKREPYAFPAVADILRWWFKLRYALIPYLWAQSRKVVQTGYPLLRALIFDHGDDPTCWHIDDQYAFGDDFLVAPVMNADGRRHVYLPAGQWVDLFDGSVVEGPRWLLNFTVPLERMPVWVRRGARVPVYPDPVTCTDQMDLGRCAELVFDDSYRGIARSCLGPLLNPHAREC